MSATTEPTTNGVAAHPLSPLDVLTLPQAAAYLQVGEDVILREVEDGRIPGRKLGGEWRFLRLAVSDWLRAAPGLEPTSPGARRVVYIGGTPISAPEME
jgi:excisionase family DNA binding protein